MDELVGGQSPDMLMTRRLMLAMTGAGIASAAGGALLAADPAAGTPIRSQPPLSHFPSEAEMWRDVVFMTDMGPRYTGNAAHQRYVKFLKDQFTGMGMTVEGAQRDTLTLWEATASGLRTAAGKDIAIASICRWSATTGPDGVTAPLKFIGRADGPSFYAGGAARTRVIDIAIPADIAGKIALVEVMAQPLRLQEMFGDRIAAFVDPSGAGPVPEVQSTTPAWTTVERLLPSGFEANLRSAGAVGIIYVWANGVEADAHGQYRRTGTEALPSLWVGMTSGKELRALADTGEPVTMTVEAKVTKNVPTETIIATLPGQTDEILLVWGHTDGMNAVDENGGIAILNLMKHFSALPLSARKRTIVCLLTDGHLATQYLPDDWWVAGRPELARKAVAAVSVGHLGCREWVADPAQGSFVDTGKPDIYWAFTLSPPDRPNALVGVMKEALKGSRKSRTAVIDRSDRAFSPALHVWNVGKIPLIATICTNAYFLAEAQNGQIDKIRPDLFFDQMQILARALHIMDDLPKEVLRPA